MNQLRVYRIAAWSLPASLLANTVVAAEEGTKPGLPQFDVSLFPSQLFWLAVLFALLYVLMAYVALPRVKRVQDNRLQIIQSELTAAKIASEDAKALMAKADKALADARANALASVNDIKLQAAKDAGQQQVRQQKDLGQKLHEAETRIYAARDAAIKDAQAGAAELARSIVERVTAAGVGR